MSKEKLEGLVKRMEVTLVEMEQLKLHCGRQSEELSQLVVELRRENQELAEKYNQLAQDMKEAKEIIEQLQDTKYAFDAKERQAQKLSRQLWETTNGLVTQSLLGACGVLMGILAITETCYKRLEETTWTWKHIYTVCFCLCVLGQGMYKYKIFHCWVLI